MLIDQYSNRLYHHGILGQKWGIRRFQNEDGSLTDAGKRRYAKGKTFGIDERAYSEYKRRVLNSMTYDELKNANSRHIQEENYIKNYFTEKGTKTSILSVVGKPLKTVFEEPVKKVGKYYGQKAVEKMLGPERSALIFGNKNNDNNNNNDNKNKNKGNNTSYNEIKKAVKEVFSETSSDFQKVVSKEIAKEKKREERAAKKAIGPQPGLKK